MRKLVAEKAAEKAEQAAEKGTTTSELNKAIPCQQLQNIQQIAVENATGIQIAFAIEQNATGNSTQLQNAPLTLLEVETTAPQFQITYHGSQTLQLPHIMTGPSLTTAMFPDNMPSQTPKSGTDNRPSPKRRKIVLTAEPEPEPEPEPETRTESKHKYLCRYCGRIKRSNSHSLKPTIMCECGGKRGKAPCEHTALVTHSGDIQCDIWCACRWERI